MRFSLSNVDGLIFLVKSVKPHYQSLHLKTTYELINNEQGEFYNVFSERLNKYLTRKVGEIAKAGDNVIFERGLWSSKERTEIRNYYKNNEY